MGGKALSLESYTKAGRDHIVTRAAGQRRLPAAAPATCGAAQLRGCSDSDGKPLTSVGTAGKAQRPRPGSAAARRGQCPWLCVFPCGSRAPASPCPFLRRAEGLASGPEPWRWDKSLGAPHPPTAPGAPCGLRAGGSGGCGSGGLRVRGAAMVTRRASPAPRGSAVLFPTLLHQPWPGRGRVGSAGEQLTPERRLLSPHPPRLLL